MNKKADTRKTKQIRVFNHIHTLIEQDKQAEKFHAASYAGHSGFVLKKVESLKN